MAALPLPEYEPCQEFDRRSLVSLVQDRVPAMPVEEAFVWFNAVAPKGWRVELIEGEIHVTPPPNGEHEEIVSEINGQVRDHRKDLGRYTSIGLYVPGASLTGQVMPDLVLAPKGSFANEDKYHDPAAVLLVAEVTSRSTGDNDRHKKILGYARAGIPVYLLIDREAGNAVLYTEPAGEEYEHQEIFKLSKVVPLPEPLGFELDTSEF
ncbi:Uma2 family endonuclease [Streptomyces venezuelae]|uniref:Uma2 family endonuclease n=1 Tax=Streptomyces venezuelae TaxID=54571 RepID=UPI003F54222A